MNKMKKSKKNRILQCTTVILLFLLIFGQALKLHAAESVYKSGYMYFKLSGGDKNSTIQIHVWKTANFTHDDMKNKAMLWNVEISDATNNHSVKLLKSQVTTTKDNEGDYYILPIPISYVVPANHEVNGQTLTTELDESEGRCGLYVSQSGSKYYSAACVDNDTTKSQYLMVNTAQVGLRTVDGYRYNYTTGSRAIVTLTLKRPKYKVTFNTGTGTSWGSATTKTATVARGNTASITAPTKTGYTFAGWDKTLTNVKSSFTTNAKWTANNYPCNFYANGGIGTMDGQDIAYDSTATLKKNTFQRTGYIFAGWSTEKRGKVIYKDGDSIKMSSTSGIDLYAIWKKKGLISDFTNVEEDEGMFYGDEKLEGGNGTVYDNRHTTSDYAHTDEEDDPGYFTGK